MGSLQDPNYMQQFDTDSQPISIQARASLQVRLRAAVR